MFLYYQIYLHHLHDNTTHNCGQIFSIYRRVESYHRSTHQYTIVQIWDVKLRPRLNRRNPRHRSRKSRDLIPVDTIIGRLDPITTRCKKTRASRHSERKKADSIPFEIEIGVWVTEETLTLISFGGRVSFIFYLPHRVSGSSRALDMARVFDERRSKMAGVLRRRGESKRDKRVKGPMNVIRIVFLW